MSSSQKDSAFAGVGAGNIKSAGDSPGDSSGILASQRSAGRAILGVLVIAALAFLVYRPMFPGSFLMDDHRLVADDNPLVNGEFTLGNIWFQTDFILSNIGFWLQWLAWGDHPGNYHAVNVLLHVASAIILWRLLRALEIPGAWVAAAVYAVHPVAVTSVARIAELKNTLSLPFFLLSFWFYLLYEKKASAPSVRPFRVAGWYALSLAAFALALLAKTSTVMLPPVLLFYVLWRRGRLTRTDEWRLGPFFVMALVFGVMSTWFQKYQALADQSLPYRSFAERLATAGNIVWFYLGKVLLPVKLNAFYPVWKVDPGSPAAWLPLLSVVALAGVGWRCRHGWGRHLLFGLGCFLVLLFPVLGFFDAQYLTWFQVSDHLQYLPMLAPLVLAVAVLAWWLGTAGFRLAAPLLILGSALLAFHRATVFSNEENLMRDCLAKNPAAWGAQNSLGTILARRLDYAGAITKFEAAYRCQPDDPLVNLNLGHALALTGRFDEAVPLFLTALRRTPVDPEAHRQFAHALELHGRKREAIEHLQIALGLKPDVQTRLQCAALLFAAGDFRRSEYQLRLAVREQQDLPDALNNLAWLLATAPEDSLRNGPEAVGYAEKACALTGRKQAGMLGTLAAAYAEAGRFPDAIRTCQQTIELANASGQTGFAAANSQLLNLYQSGRAYHSPPMPVTGAN